MRLSATLSIYIGRQFLVGIGLAFLALVLLILVFDLVELTRRASGNPNVGTILVVQMALLHLPHLSERVIPYAVLIGVMLSLSHMTRTSELVIARASGVSAWQFLFPGITLALAIGFLMMAVFNPLASAMLSRFDNLDARYMRGQVSNLSVSSSGLWLRQSDDIGESVIHALRIEQDDLLLHDVIAFRYRDSDHFVERIDAATARLGTGEWQLREALVTGPDRAAERLDTYVLPTELTIGQIQDSFASPETLSFWQIPGFIELLERAGFSALRHKVHWHAVLASPLLLVGMVLLGAAFSLRMTRRGGTGLLISGGVLVGFVIYVFSDVALALGVSASIPVVLSGWAAAAVSTLIGLAILLFLEDS